MDPLKFGLTRPTYRVKELVFLLRIGRSSIYEAVREGKLKAHKIGRSTVFLATDVAEYLQDLPLLPAKRKGGAQ
jgi:excisionase family DNA binding protein